MSARAIFCARALLPTGWAEAVCLRLDEAGMITDVEVGEGRRTASARPGDRLELTGAVVPGMPNLHSHAFQRLMAGLGQAGGETDDSFWTWRDAMYAIAGRVTPEQLEACAAGLYVEMLRRGYTTCAEFHYLHHGPDGVPYVDRAEMGKRVLAAGSRAGLGLTLLPVLYQRAGFSDDPVSHHQQRFCNSTDDYQRLVQSLLSATTESDLACIGIAPHSLRAVGEVALRDVLGAGASGPVHIHIAEQRLEVEDCVANLGARPVEWLLDHFEVDAHWCLVHATHMTTIEGDRAAATGAVAGLCPTTEADLGDGIFPAEAWQQRGGAWGVGSDSNLRVCPAEELRLLECTQRLVTGRRNVMTDRGHGTGARMWTSAAQGGAQALGQPVGRIARGYRADLVALDLAHPGLDGLSGDEVLDTFVFAGNADMIDSVWVAGECQVERGRHRNEDQIMPAFHRALRDLRVAQ